MNPAPAGPAPLNYAVPPQYSLPPKAGGGWRRGLFGWLLFLGLAVLLLVGLRSKGPAATEIPLSDFYRLLKQGSVQSVTIRDDEVRGTLDSPTVLGTLSHPVQNFRAALPQAVGSNWQFTQWVLDNANGAHVSAEGGGSLLMNIVVPLIPWVLIFGFIWFFVFRQLRQAARPQQPWPVVVVNPAAPGGAPPPSVPPGMSPSGPQQTPGA